MRDYVGIAPATLPKPEAPDFQPRLRDKLFEIDYFLRDLTRGVARIQVGEVPDGSGDPIGTGGVLGDLYWYRPGLGSFGTAFMDTGPGASGTISSTTDPTKGSIFFGAVAALDERDSALGVGTTSPLATIHLRRPSTDSLTLRPDGDVAAAGGQGQDGGTSNLYAYLNDQSDSTYVTWGGATANFSLTNGTDPGIHTGHIVRYHYRNTSSSASGRNLIVSLYEIGTLIADGTTHSDIPVSSTWTEASFTLTEAQAAAITNYSDLRIIVATGGAGGLEGPSVSELSLELPNGTTGGLARWDNVSGTQLGQIDNLGRVGVNTAGNALSAWLTVKGSAETDTLATVLNSAGSSRFRLQGVSGGGVDAYFYPSGGDGVIIRSPSSGGTGRIGIGVAGSPAGSIHVAAENGAATGILIWPFSSSSGPSLTITSPGGTSSVWSMLDGVRTHRTYTGQAAGTLLTIQNGLGNAACLQQKIILHASQSGDCFQVRDSTDTTSRLSIGLSGGLTVIPGAAAVSLILQRHASGTATDIMRVQNSSGNIVGKFSAAGRFSLDPAGTTTTTLSTTGIFNVSTNSVTVPAINSLFTIDAASGFPNGLWRFVPTITDTGAVGSHVTCLRVAPTFSTGGTSLGITCAATIADDTSGGGIFRAMDFTVDITSTNPVGTVGGAVGSITYASSANITTINAISAAGVFSGSGTVGELIMLKCTGNIVSGTFGAATGMYLDVGGNATATTVKGIHSYDISHDGVTDTACWFLYGETTAQNWLRGNLGIGASMTVPTAKVHTAAGSTSAGSAAFKQTAGALMTSPEAGAEEYDGSYFYKTNGRARGAVCSTANVLVDGAGDVLTAGGEILLAA